MDAYLQAAILGVVEAATEFLPVSSTGHLLLADKILGFVGPENGVFEVAIQLGAILAIVVLYFKKLWSVLVGLPTKAEAQKFTLFVLLAFFPAAIVGLAIHDFIKTVLFDPTIVCVALILGGAAILLVEQFAPKAQVHTVETMGWKKALGVGIGQCLSLIPGVSRSGATILTALSLGVDRKVATEFSFFLSIPTMFGAVGYDLFKNRHELAADSHSMTLIAIGFVVAFVLALPIAKWLVGFVSKHGFAPFAYYRIVVGFLGLFLLGLSAG
jgi:undecaprenyl-diphosphatase